MPPGIQLDQHGAYWSTLEGEEAKLWRARNPGRTLPRPALAIAAGVDIFTLSRRMGHESITTTADRYGHLYKGQDDDAHAIERLLKKA